MSYDGDTPGMGITCGSSVADSDGRHLGTVAEVGAEHFKIQVHLGRDFWLPFDLVQRFDDESTVLTMPSAAIESRRIYSGIEHLPKEELDGSVKPADYSTPGQIVEASRAAALRDPR